LVGVSNDGTSSWLEHDPIRNIILGLEDSDGRRCEVGRRRIHDAARHSTGRTPLQFTAPPRSHRSPQRINISAQTILSDRSAQVLDTTDASPRDPGYHGKGRRHGKWVVRANGSCAGTRRRKTAWMKARRPAIHLYLMTSLKSRRRWRLSFTLHTPHTPNLRVFRCSRLPVGAVKFLQNHTRPSPYPF
jgi:hypothetical protein